MIKLHGKIHSRKRQLYRADLYKNQGGKCYWCHRPLLCWHPRYASQKSGRASSYMEIDHIIPRCAGGSNHFSNLVGACKQCNVKRSSLYLKYIHFFTILGQESPAELLGRYHSQNSTTENNKEAA